jgi:hypothetical protein
MYFGITKIYYRKTVGHIFTKPVQIEGTTQKFFPPSKLFFIVVHISPTRRCKCMQWENGRSRGRSRFVCCNITPVSLWLPCNVLLVQSIRPTIATWPRWPKCTDHCTSEEYRCTHVDACVARTWISYRCVPCHPRCTHRTSLVVKKKKPFSVFLWLWTIPLR